MVNKSVTCVVAIVSPTIHSQPYYTQSALLYTVSPTIHSQPYYTQPALLYTVSPTIRSQSYYTQPALSRAFLTRQGPICFIASNHLSITQPKTRMSI